jgi:hypothetical protein
MLLFKRQWCALQPYDVHLPTSSTFFYTSVLCEVHEIKKYAHALQFEWLRSSLVMHVLAMLLNRLFENSVLMQRKRPSISKAGQEVEGCAPARRRLKLAQNMSL